uniref:Uncharacterized protein n=1 Tax=Chromera velia CCMP2878 TaxID=1169474 RepID=A0A0G4GGX1_9ALVE|eukprot:Cvel_21849.t1-p1 / transcript=Cvel_21849.t1 / gene=Cvel_21849 / organism=Chromera_velia_CCMP2878 / gene_product=hypothetical protein / transcript_product=hypothetical protein / location=Cvel_scaffold2087:27928-29858(+) / protein_length=92 / sequence_SO=supercontig / SO=protein_coding / is_pseudo=false
MEYEKSLATSLKNLAHSADENFIESEKRLHAWRAARLNAYHEQGELFGVKEEDKEGVKGGFEAKREERKNARKAAQEARPKSQQLTPFEDAE